MTTTQPLERMYLFREPAKVTEFLESYPFLISLLLEAYDTIRNYFPDAQVFLEVIADQEAVNYKELVIFIATDLKPDEALDRLDQFDENWWLDASDRARGKLSIHVEFL